MKDDAENTQQTRRIQATWQELAIVTAIIGAFLAICFSTSSRFPIVWGDEVYFTEPAVNANLGLGFTSYANLFQPPRRFWAGNTPLYSMLLTCWLKVFGIGLVEVRSLGYVLGALAALTFWWATIRLGLMTSVRMRIGFLLTILFAYGPGCSYRDGRYDTLSIFIASLTLLSASLSSVPLRLALITALGACWTMTQLSLVPFAAEIGALLVIFYGRSYFREVVALGIGTVLGGAFLYALYQSQGVWPDFITHFAYNRKLRDSGVLGLPKDPSLVMILIAGGILLVDQLWRGNLRWRSPIVVGFTAGVLIPVGQLVLGWFPTHYTWMAILPLSAGIFSELSRSGSAIGPRVRALAVTTLAVGVSLGMPLQLASAATFWKERDYSRVVSLVSGAVNKDDWVYCESGAYYAAKAIAAGVFIHVNPGLDLDPDDKRRISVVIVAPWEIEKISKNLGGTWSPVGEPILPPEKNLLFFRRGFGDQLVKNYFLQAYRRVRE